MPFHYAELIVKEYLRLNKCLFRSSIFSYACSLSIRDIVRLGSCVERYRSESNCERRREYAHDLTLAHLRSIRADSRVNYGLSPTRTIVKQNRTNNYGLGEELIACLDIDYISKHCEPEALGRVLKLIISFDVISEVNIKVLLNAVVKHPDLTFVEEELKAWQFWDPGLVASVITVFCESHTVHEYLNNVFVGSIYYDSQFDMSFFESKQFRSLHQKLIFNKGLFSPTEEPKIYASSGDEVARKTLQKSVLALQLKKIEDYTTNLLNNRFQDTPVLQFLMQKFHGFSEHEAYRIVEYCNRRRIAHMDYGQTPFDDIGLYAFVTEARARHKYHPKESPYNKLISETQTARLFRLSGLDRVDVFRPDVRSAVAVR